MIEVKVLTITVPVFVSVLTSKGFEQSLQWSCIDSWVV